MKLASDWLMDNHICIIFSKWSWWGRRKV